MREKSRIYMKRRNMITLNGITKIYNINDKKR